MPAKTTNADAGNRSSPPQPQPPAQSEQFEDYTPERIAEFLMNNAVNLLDYAAAVEEVRELGIDPAKVPTDPEKQGFATRESL